MIALMQRLREEIRQHHQQLTVNTSEVCLPTNHFLALLQYHYSDADRPIAYNIIQDNIYRGDVSVCGIPLKVR